MSRLFASLLICLLHVGFVRAAFWSSCSYHIDAAARLQDALQSRLFGQPMAIAHITNQISAHIADPTPQKPLVLSLHGNTGIGKSYSTRLIEESLFSARGRAKHVHRFSGGRYGNVDELREYIRFFESELRSAIVLCPNALFVFDEAHLMAPGLLDRMLPYMEHGASVDKLSYTSAIFIIVSNLGARTLNQIFISSALGQRSLPSYESIVTDLREDLIRSARAAASIQQSDSTAFDAQRGLSVSMLVQQHILWFVPYFPLTAAPVRQCVEAQLVDRLKRSVSAGEFASFGVHPQVIDWLAARVYLDSRNLSISGCKQVSDLVVAKVVGVLQSKNHARRAPDWSLHQLLASAPTRDWSESHVSLYPPLQWLQPGAAELIPVEPNVVGTISDGGDLVRVVISLKSQSHSEL